MLQRIVIGNIISLTASFFLFSGSITEKVKSVYLFGIFECIFLFIAQLFFGQGAAAVSLLIAAFRNLLLFLERYTRPFFITVFLATLFLGLFFNTGGTLGLLPLFATLIFTVTTYCAKEYIKVKLSLLLNLVLWTLYSLLILDLSSTVINITSSVLTVFSILKHLKNNE
ncbi:MAG: YgjV family protein [Clostridia bacterium]|nr:YgjV family protein [Clostridia bacterium]